jgi:hypothetical protein
MFSNTSLIKQAIILIASLILASVMLLPRLMSSPVKAAQSQPSNMEEVNAKKVDPRSVSVNAEAAKIDSANVLKTTISTSISETSSRRAEGWMSWDVVPTLSQNALSIYQKGLALGNNPRAFSKVGDGEISAAWFLSDFDLGPDYYNLGSNTDLQSTIAYFTGSYDRQGFAARRGFNAQRILDSALANTTYCLSGETSLDCEIRLHQPSFALISFGTNQVWQPDQFESGLRTIIETLIAKGVVPVLSTKADNLEGNYRINSIIARLAVEYDLPLWNFWRAVQPLPNQGLQQDFEHITYYPNDFSAPEALQYAWPVRNLTALQVLQALMIETQAQ